MAKMNKDYELRMQGMIYASNIVSKKGVEGLKEDIRIRNVLKAPMKFYSITNTRVLGYIVGEFIQYRAYGHSTGAS